MSSNPILRIVNRDSIDFSVVGWDFSVGFDRRFEENPSAFHRINPLDLLREDWSTIVLYKGKVPVAGLVVDASEPAEWLLKGLWSTGNGCGREALVLTKGVFAKIDDKRPWRARVRIDRAGKVNARPISALLAVGYKPEAISVFEVQRTPADRHLADEADLDGRYRALDFVRPSMAESRREKHV